MSGLVGFKYKYIFKGFTTFPEATLVFNANNTFTEWWKEPKKYKKSVIICHNLSSRTDNYKTYLQKMSISSNNNPFEIEQYMYMLITKLALHKTKFGK